MTQPRQPEDEFAAAFDDAAHPERGVGRLSDEQLLAALSEETQGTVYRLALEAELRKREAWRTPAASSVRIAKMALGVSFLALLVSGGALWQAVQSPIAPAVGSNNQPISVPVEATRVQSPSQTRSPLPLAHVELRNGDTLRDQNPDAYRVRYLNKRYRVVGTVDEISGSSGPFTVFSLRLRPWPRAKGLARTIGPQLAFTEYSSQWALALRPGAPIDAECTLAEQTPPPINYQFSECGLKLERAEKKGR